MINGLSYLTKQSQNNAKLRKQNTNIWYTRYIGYIVDIYHINYRNKLLNKIECELYDKYDKYYEYYEYFCDNNMMEIYTNLDMD